ncbi:hypothetical protein NO989_20050 [Alteromonas sp. DY56-G5]|uniref:hypothetical protein n=1 Tax=Alteromonas sp. DY56-G5 TaxID=2967128 RepID=UPI00352A495D|tara:strand:+ start:44 stop:220 length:177 start_codon:yes stop_codon:yes gene_type:complete
MKKSHSYDKLYIIEVSTSGFGSHDEVWKKWWPHPDLNRGPADYETQTERLPIVTLFTC